MPIHFRCPTCFGLLSIARRKAGKVVHCPKCGDNVIVPSNPRAEEDDDATAVVEIGVSKPTHAAAASDSGKLDEIAREHVALQTKQAAAMKSTPRTESPKPPSPKVERKLKPVVPTKSKEDSPLFEREDFEELLNPAAKKLAEQQAQSGGAARGLAGTASAREAVVDAVPLEVPIPIGEEGIFITKSSATMLAVMVFVLLGLSFAAGYLVGS